MASGHSRSLTRTLGTPNSFRFVKSQGLKNLLLASILLALAVQASTITQNSNLSINNVKMDPEEPSTMAHDFKMLAAVSTEALTQSKVDGCPPDKFASFTKHVASCQ